MRHKRKTLTLRTKAIGLSVAITISALAAVTITGVVQMRQQIDAEQRRAVDAMTLGFAQAAEQAMARSDRSALTRLTSSLVHDENVLFAVVCDATDQPIASAIRDRPAYALYQQGQIDSGRFTLGQRELESNEPPRPGSASRAYVVVGLSNIPATAALHRHNLRTLSISSLAAAIGAIILSVTLERWMRRMQRLVQASVAISRGNFSAPTHDDRDDEIGKLARAFDAMRIALAQRDVQLREFTQTLQQQVLSRTAELERAVAAAEEANRAKSLFLANMSHELRTPLNGVIGMIDLLIGADPTARQRRYCEMARSSAHCLLELINDILDFSKIEAGKLELDPTDFDLPELIHEVLQLMGDRAEKKGLELACRIAPDVPQSVRGDALRLRQVILNLVSNAIKFTEKGEIVVGVAIESADAANTTVRIVVRDTGIGIPPDRVNRLFKSFSQVDASTTRKFGGTGLGLAISQRIAGMMGGGIGVESQPGLGSTFWFTARLEKRAAATPTRQQPSFDPRGLRALAVDDNQANRQILHDQLRSWGVRADVADDANSALAMLRQAVESRDPYRIAVLDMHMPHVDGAQLARQIQADLALADTILISLGSVSDQVKDGMGFSASLTKPALPSQLYDAIVDGLARSSRGESSSGNGLLETKAPRLPGVRVLVAEDNEVNRLVASEILAQAGCLCDMVVNGRAALEAALAGNHDLILMDCQMPEMDGFEATAAIRDAERKDPNSRRRTVIALTANAIKGDREQCLAAGMDGYVTKPIDPLELLTTMRDLLPAGRLAEQADAPLAVSPSAKINIVTPPARQADAPPAPSPSAKITIAGDPPISPAAQQATPTDAVPPLDFEALRKRCLGNAKIATKAIRTFDAAIGNDLATLRQSLQSGDSRSAAASAHKLKGSAANVSAEGIRRIASELEQLARNDSLAQAESFLEQLRLEAQRLHEYIATTMTSSVPPSTVAAPG